MPRFLSGRPSSFRVQLALLIGCVSITLSTAVTGLFANVLITQIQRDKGLALAAIGQNLVHSLQEGLHERSRQVELLAGSIELWRHGLDSNSAVEALTRARSSRDDAAWVGVADLQGRVRAAADGVLLGADVSARPWFQGGQKGDFVGDVHAAKLLASVLPPQPSGEPARFLDFAAPVVLDGQALGVVGMHGSWDWAGQLVRGALPADAEEDGIEVCIANKGGDFLLAPRGAALEPGRFARALEAGRLHGGGAESTGAPALVWEDGETYLTTALEVPEPREGAALGWKVVVRQPASVAYAQVRRTVLLGAGVGLLLALLSTTFAWLGSGYLSRPLVTIAEAAGRVERGEPGAAIPQTRSSRELAALSGALASMTERLLQSREALEQRVEERTNALRTANLQLQRLSIEQHAMLDNELVGMLKLVKGRIVWSNRAAAGMLGYGAAELLGLKAAALLCDEGAATRVTTESREALARSGHFRHQTQLRRLDGELIWVDLSGALLDPVNGETLWLLLDISTIKQHQQQIEHIAFHDGLTGLANRLLLADRLQQAVAQSARSGRSFAICHIDLDGFKAVNDEFGHAAGDQLLREVAQRLGACIRASDTAARFGGDEFVILLMPVSGAAECEPVAQRLVEAVRRPVKLADGRQASVSASIGISIYPEDGHDGAGLIARSDAAMYRAKREGKNQYRFARAANDADA